MDKKLKKKKSGNVIVNPELETPPVNGSSLAEKILRKYSKKTYQSK